MQKNASAIYQTQKCQVRFGNVAGYTRKGNTLYTHVHFWPGDTVTVGGIKTKVTSAKLLASSKPVQFTQKGSQLLFTGLPSKAPDDPVTVIAAECEAEPVQDSLASRVIDRIIELEPKQQT
jgi:alpha-L-fucosidase